MRNTTWTKTWPVAAVAVTAMIWTASVFLSDDTGSPWEHPMPSSDIISPKHVDRYADTLNLDEGQREYLGALYEIYHTALEETITKQNVENRTSGLLTDFQRVAAQRDEVEWAFFRDLRLGLTAEQLERWPALERLRRRELRPGMIMVGHAIIGWTDVVGALHEIKPDAVKDETIGVLVRRFEMEDDARRQTAIELCTPGSAQEQTDSERRLAIQKMTAEREETALALLDRLRRLLGRADGFRFLRACLQIAPSNVERDIERALSLDDLTDAQRKEILTLRDNHQHRVWPMSDELLDMTIQHQRKGTKHAGCGQTVLFPDHPMRPPCQQMPLAVPDGQGGFTTAPPPSPAEPCPFEPLQRKHSEAHAHTAARLQNILTAAQTKRLANRAERERLQRPIDAARRALERGQREIDWAREQGHDTAPFEQDLEFPKKRLEQATEALEAFEKAAATP